MHDTPLVYISAITVSGSAYLQLFLLPHTDTVVYCLNRGNTTCTIHHLFTTIKVLASAYLQQCDATALVKG